jgi:hypothetical protein
MKFPRDAALVLLGVILTVATLLTLNILNLPVPVLSQPKTSTTINSDELSADEAKLLAKVKKLVDAKQIDGFGKPDWQDRARRRWTLSKILRLEIDQTERESPESQTISGEDFGGSIPAEPPLAITWVIIFQRTITDSGERWTPVHTKQIKAKRVSF